MVRVWSGTVRLNFFPGHGARYSPERYSEHSPALFRRHDTNTVDTDLQLQVSDVQLKLNPISTSLYVTRRETWTFHGEEKRSSYNYLKSRLTKIYYTWNFKYNFSKKRKIHRLVDKSFLELISIILKVARHLISSCLSSRSSVPEMQRWRDDLSGNRFSEPWTCTEIQIYPGGLWRIFLGPPIRRTDWRYRIVSWPMGGRLITVKRCTSGTSVGRRKVRL